jgi:Integrase zinc binding domain
VSFVKGKENVVADALSRIEIKSEDLDKLQGHVEKSTVLVLTRQQKRLEEDQRRNFAEGTECVAPEPTLCEILRRPKDGVEIKVLQGNQVKRENGDVVANRKKNLWFVENTQTIYLDVASSKAGLDYVSVLQDLPRFCRTLNISELVIIKEEANRELLQKVKGIIRLLKNENIKISVLSGVQKITGADTREIIMNDFHTLPTGAHAGVTRMARNIRKYYHWEGIEKDVRTFVSKCDSCQRFKYSLPLTQPMVVTTTASSALSKIYLDVVGSIERDEAGFSYILTVQCELSKYVLAVPLINKEARTVAKAFVENFVLKYGIPSAIATDCGTEFLADVMKQTCKFLHVEQLQSTAYHHQSVGGLENSHKHLGSFLRAQVAKYKNSWSTWVSYWCFAFNTTVHCETRFTPFELVFGKSCVLPSNIVNASAEPLYNPDNYFCELKYRLKCACKEAQENLIKSKIKRKVNYDSQTKPYRYQPGDLILLKNEQRKKLEPIFTGPYKVINDSNPNLEIELKDKKYLVHKNRVKPYIFYFIQ